MSWYNPVSWWIDKENLDAGNKAYEQSVKKDQPGGATYEKIEGIYGTQAADDHLKQVLDQGQTGGVLSYDEAVDQVDNSFWEGWNTAYDERTGQGKALLNAPFKVLFDIMPWYFWLIGAVALFIYLGGGVVVRKQIAKLA